MNANTEKSMRAPRFKDGVAEGSVLEKSGYHQPGGRGRNAPRCGCSKTTEKGAYRDVTVELPDGSIVHYYHQSPVVVRDGQQYRLDNHGYKTSTTKERINRHIPSGYSVVQRDFTWYVETPDGDRLEFENGMVLDTREH